MELYLNDISLGSKSKENDSFHVRWRVPYKAGALKAISRKNRKVILEKKINTAGEPAKIHMIPDKEKIHADGKDLSFVTVNIIDKDDNFVPIAENFITFEIQEKGKIVGVDNGYQASLEPFKANYRKAFNGLCLLIIQSTEKPGNILVKAGSEELTEDTIIIKIK